jgi:hypothetical protein
MRRLSHGLWTVRYWPIPGGGTVADDAQIDAPNDVVRSGRTHAERHMARLLVDVRGRLGSLTDGRFDSDRGGARERI